MKWLVKSGRTLSLCILLTTDPSSALTPCGRFVQAHSAFIFDHSRDIGDIVSKSPTKFENLCSLYLNYSNNPSALDVYTLRKAFDELSLEQKLEVYRRVESKVYLYNLSFRGDLETTHRALPEKGTILDYGCGPGIEPAYLQYAAPDRNLILADVNLYHLGMARRLMKEVRRNQKVPDSTQYLEADSKSLSIIPGSLNGVVLNNTLLYVTPIRRLEFLQRLYEGMKPGTVLVIHEPKMVMDENALTDRLRRIYHAMRFGANFTRAEIGILAFIDLPEHLAPKMYYGPNTDPDWYPSATSLEYLRTLTERIGFKPDPRFPPKNSRDSFRLVLRR